MFLHIFYQQKNSTTSRKWCCSGRKKMQFMKITSMLLLAACLHVSASAFNQTITLSEKKAPLEKIFREIKIQSGYLFFYDPDVIKKALPVDIKVEKAALEDVLRICFKDQPLEYTISNKVIIVNYKTNKPDPASTFLSPPIDIRGRIMDEEGNALPGATIKLKGNDKGTATDAGGNFVLQVPDNKGILVVSFIGYQTREVPVGASLTIILKREDTKINDVVVIGYGTRKKSDLTGSLSYVSNKDFENQPVTRLDQALQGRATGVQVTSASGSPGGDVRIRIRGANSLTGDNNPLYVVDGFVGADFNNVNTEDIASIVVLKDASSTAIYGSRGANGVIIITTKSGKSGKMQVSLLTRLSASNVIGTYNTMNAADFAETVNARGLALTPAGQTYTPRFSDAEIQQFRQKGGTNWQDEIFRTGMGQEYQLGFSGGTDKTNYLISGNYLNQEGIIHNSDFKRYSVRSNIASQISDKFSVRLNFTGIRRENHNTSGTGARGGSLGQALAWAPTTPVYTPKGTYTIKDPTSSIFSNPVAINEQSDNRNDRTNINLIGGARYQFLPELSLDVQGGINYTNDQAKGYAGPAITGNVPSASRNSGENILVQNTNNLTYKKTFNKDHQLELTTVLETQQFKGTGFNVSVNGLTYPDQTYNNIALSKSSQVGSGYSEWSLLSLLGRANYAYKDKYFLSGSIRRDGSSKFRGKNKFSTFPSAAVGWKLSEEPFLKNTNIFNNLKLRGSWGLTGNQGINPYATYSAYTTNLDDAGTVFNGASGKIVSGIALGNPGNPELKWETTEQINAGLDVEIFQGAVTFTADYFVKKTRDLLLNQPVPGYLGGNFILSNIGDMRNTGWEFSVGVNAFSKREFNWNSSFNVSFVKNTLESLGEGRKEILFNEFILRPGQPIGSFFGYKYLGTYKPNEAAEAAKYNLKPGDAHYDDFNKDGVISDKDYQIIGNALPKTSLGWNNTFTYKNFALNVFVQGLFGLDKLNYSYAFGMLGSTDAKEILFADIKNRYIPGVNETSDIPAFSSAPTNTLNQSSRFVEKADFLRLKNLSLSYDIKKTALKNIAGVKVFLSATNLLTFTRYRGIDPESNSNNQSEGLNWSGFVADTEQGIDQGAYPNAKTYTIGVNVIF
ncbi:TonB-linked outer membrane protein, SusC/RagA family [Chitinophaga arvensicola]|uniref:TonB-linked outer membrane protein, SusC/RagA family n=2 Tax=Chitinophaga arvensicola TaxID=29529 RepID=A0A1I0R431_9BACT|nr:TonB-linked outer membrane protein, SusC/RagA family [Chitinophaga arvensicola]